MSTTQPVIRTAGLTKTFGPVRALIASALGVAASIGFRRRGAPQG